MSRDARSYLVAALDHLAVLDRHIAKGSLRDEIVIDAVCLRLSAAIESASRIGPELLSRGFGEQWPAIWAVRNRIAHGYVYIDEQIITDTINNDIPGFRSAIRRLLDELTPDAVSKPWPSHRSE